MMDFHAGHIAEPLAEKPGQAGIELDYELAKTRILKNWGMAPRSEIAGMILEHPERVDEVLEHYERLIRSNLFLDTAQLVPGVGEIIGGSQREERLDMLEKRIAELGMDLSQYDWYLELRKYGGVKHAGFGLGFERIIMYVTGMQNIRDVLPFPRTTSNMEM